MGKVRIDRPDMVLPNTTAEQIAWLRKLFRMTTADVLVHAVDYYYHVCIREREQKNKEAAKRRRAALVVEKEEGNVSLG